jgi:hypothetical protein
MPCYLAGVAFIAAASKFQYKLIMAWAFLIRVIISAILIALIALIAKRSPNIAGMIASLPLVSTLGMVWLWVDTKDVDRVADYTQSAFWFFLPTMPMFLFIPYMLRNGWGFWTSLGAGLAITIILYLVMVRILTQFGISL